MEAYKCGERGGDMVKMTKMQQKIYDTIAEALQRQGYPPSVREIGDAVGLSSTSSVQYNLNKLERMGCIERDPNCKRTIRLPGRAAQVAQVPLLGTVTAGVPILATQHIEEYIPVFGARPGEELFAIARRFHVSPAQMLAANDLAEGSTAIDAPRRLLVPGAGG